MFIPRYVIEDFAISFDDLERRSCDLNTSLYHWWLFYLMI